MSQDKCKFDSETEQQTNLSPSDYDYLINLFGDKTTNDEGCWIVDCRLSDGTAKIDYQKNHIVVT